MSIQTLKPDAAGSGKPLSSDHRYGADVETMSVLRLLRARDCFTLLPLVVMGFR